MRDDRVLRGTELRYALTTYLGRHGPSTIAEMIDGLEHQGFVVVGYPPKSVSDALRWEGVHGRVFRRGRGLYDAFEMPRSTEHRITRRVNDLRTRAKRLLEASDTREFRSEVGRSSDGPDAAPNAKDG